MATVWLVVYDENMKMIIHNRVHDSVSDANLTLANLSLIVGKKYDHYWNETETLKLLPELESMMAVRIFNECNMVQDRLDQGYHHEDVWGEIRNSNKTQKTEGTSHCVIM